MLNVVRGFAIASIVALGALGLSNGSASALALPIQQKSADAELTAQNGNIQPVVEHRRRIYWRNRQARFGYARQGYNPRTWRRPGRYWGYRRDRYYWPRYRSRFYYDPFWGADPWWDDGPPVIVAPRVSYRGSAHVEWCLDRYRSYNPRTNTWVGYSGKVYQCDSPYDRR